MTNAISLDLLALTMFASLVSLLGGIAFLYTKKLSILLEKYGVPFAAGTMIVTALVGLLPEAIHALGTTSLALFTISFLTLFALERLLIQLHHHSHAGHSHDKKTIQSSIPVVLIGDTIHNFIDGVAIAVAYATNPGLAVATALSTFLHEVPHEIGDFSILLKAGFSKSKVMVVNVLSALITIVGALLVHYVSPSEVVIGYLLAITAGIFFYLGVVDFLPHAFESDEHSSSKSKYAGVVAVLAGAIIMAVSLLAVPHGHENSQAEIESHPHDELELIHLEIDSYDDDFHEVDETELDDDQIVE